MNFQELKAYVLRALNVFYARDSDLLSQRDEWAIAHRLAVYLEQEIPGWNVDCEYNKQGSDSDSKRDATGKRVRPDIALHHRQQSELQHNLLAVELKRFLEELQHSNQEKKEISDLDKALRYTCPAEGEQTYQYQYGLALCFLPTLKCFWFRDGRQMQE
ncbi:MAG: hypothetical protein DME26_13185 [Verrucomicrobia bacterium]|nr:MAG: hypothetical protein DME26_13185 [Verrucomicrobiota bacterium]